MQMSRYFMSKSKIEAASKVQLIDYMQRRGYELKRGGHDKFLLLPHSSFIVDAAKNRWYWNAAGESGGVIDFLVSYEDMDFLTAVQTLLEFDGISFDTNLQTKPKAKKASVPFGTLPRAFENEKRVFAYLCKTRKIDPETVQTLIMQGLLYEDTRHNAVFVRYKDSKPVSCFMRGTNEQKPYKAETEWSDKRYGFFIRGNDSKTVLVFEAAIDALSFGTILHNNGKNRRSFNLLSLGGTALNSLVQYITDYPNTENIVVCTDCDAAGDTAAKSISDLFNDESRFRVIRLKPPGECKDYNESLQKGCLTDDLVNRLFSYLKLN